MRGNAQTVKERLDIAEVVGNYVKLEKAGTSLKARCPFHNEKTPSFFVSPSRQTYYCFGCGAKGDIFTFIEEFEGLEFREALKMLADKAGVELETYRESKGVKSEKDKIREVLEVATEFFENELEKNEAAKKYLLKRGLMKEIIEAWRLGYAPAEWRALYSHLVELGYGKDVLLKAGLVKPAEGKEPYDVFRDRIIFPLSDSSGGIIAFSGRALGKDAMPKYLNTPETALFTKSEVLYGLDKAKEKIRKKNYAVLVEGQIDLLLSHQAGVENTVASSGTAFTRGHLERLSRLSKRIILAFDGDKAGELAAEKSAELALSLGLEVKVAKLPDGEDPASIVSGSGDKWKEILRSSKPAIEHFLDRILEEEKDKRKAGKLIEKKLLPLAALLQSSIERSHFTSLIAKRAGIKEEVIWEDLKRVKLAGVSSKKEDTEDASGRIERRSRADEYKEVGEFLKENPLDKALLAQKEELERLMKIDELDAKIEVLRFRLREGDDGVLERIHTLTRERDDIKREAL